MTHKDYLKIALEQAATGMRNNEGGPFGAVIARNGKILGKAHNTVLKTNDPTAHAEINAIRAACSTLGKHHLSQAVLYTNFEPCPMCMAAIYWADIQAVYFISDRIETEKSGFMDSWLYKEISLSPEKRKIRFKRIHMEEINQLREEWDKKEDRELY